MNKFILPVFALGQVFGLNPLQKNPERENKKRILYFQTDSLTIFNGEKAPLHIDGEPHETAEKFEIQIIPEALRLIQP